MTERERLTTERRKIFARESLTLMSMTKEELRQHYNKIFDRLQEYEVAEENNQIIVLPCKVGNTVYVIDKRLEVYWQGTVVSVYCSYNEIKYGVSFDDGDFATYNEEDVFLTCEEAERRLKELNKGAE